MRKESRMGLIVNYLCTRYPRYTHLDELYLDQGAKTIGIKAAIRGIINRNSGGNKALFNRHPHKRGFYKLNPFCF